MIRLALAVVRGMLGLFLASFLATASYVLGLAAIIALRARRSRASPGGRC